MLRICHHWGTSGEYELPVRCRIDKLFAGGSTSCLLNRNMILSDDLVQLRGRIGRGAHDSFCILISGATDEEARERLKVLEETADGFRIAEADLQLRGPGELLGREQSGAPNFRFADLRLDWELVKLAREIVAKEGRVTT